MRNWLKYSNDLIYTGLLATFCLLLINFQEAAGKRKLLSSSNSFQLVNSKRNDSVNCSENLETLTVLMLKDLPSYANREIARRRSLSQINREFKVYNYVIVAGKPEFTPLPLNNTEYNPIFKDSSKQVFFTTLERQYIRNKAVKIQNYHWLFLTRSKSGWRMVTIYSSLGKIDKDSPPLPPEETSKSYIGRGIKVWLKDCRAGVIDRS